jgi:hypothetical protein
MARRRRRGGSRRFTSKAQWRWAFATKKPWARRHARRTPGGPKVRYRRLPRRKGARKRPSRGRR